MELMDLLQDWLENQYSTRVSKFPADTVVAEELGLCFCTNVHNEVYIWVFGYQTATEQTLNPAHPEFFEQLSAAIQAAQETEYWDKARTRYWNKWNVTTKEITSDETD